MKVFISPLNWGLGHATRIVPVIKKYRNENYTITIGANGKASAFLQQYFPEITIKEFPFPEVNYSNGLNLFSVLLKAPILIYAIWKEHRLLSGWNKKEQYDLIISDNRYGAYQKNTKSVIITHQLKIKTPFNGFWEKFINKANRYFLRKFDECWIPDNFGDKSIAGELSQFKIPKLKQKNIGLLSRFSGHKVEFERYPKYDVLIMISGPEPNRSVLIEKVIENVKKVNYSVLILGGNPNTNENCIFENGSKYQNHMNDRELYFHLRNSKYIITRSGYSSIMDLIAIGRTATLIPTPGQTEQEYLAKYVNNKNWFFTVNESDFEINKAISSLNNGNYSVPDSKFFN